MSRGFRDYYAGPYRRRLARSARDEQDLLMMVVLAEELGVPNPAAFYTLELLPAVYGEMHAWHRRAGLERSPFDTVACC
ncbi:cory-CC-star protein [Actinotalea soli]|uniref:cory-CC-star protein n=1 Tax=Actinotalea soli TaxID=2819234 RepID=UPI0027DAB983|nr:cory-CC-star protein [Actinotalea soli]